MCTLWRASTLIGDKPVVSTAAVVNGKNHIKLWGLSDGATVLMVETNDRRFLHAWKVKIPLGIVEARLRCAPGHRQRIALKEVA